jgi:dynein heavy chain, axonemal
MTFRQLPGSWSLNVEVAREEIAWTLQTLSVNALELASLWTSNGYSRALMIDVERPEFVNNLPMQVL